MQRDDFIPLYCFLLISCSVQLPRLICWFSFYRLSAPSPSSLSPSQLFPPSLSVLFSVFFILFDLCHLIPLSPLNLSASYITLIRIHFIGFRNLEFFFIAARLESLVLTLTVSSLSAGFKCRTIPPLCLQVAASTCWESALVIWFKTRVYMWLKETFIWVWVNF